MSYDMDIPPVIFFFIWFVMVLHVGFAEDVEIRWNNSCPCPQPETTCGDLVIRFPFRIKGRQPPRCGYPGFDLQCSLTNHTLLELPYSVKLTVKHINYISQTIDLFDPSSPCLYGQLQNQNLNVSASPFQFKADYNDSYTFFNCTPEDRALTRASCLSTSAYQVYALQYTSYIPSYPLSFCSIMFTIPSLPYDFFQEENTLHLKWSDPIFCKHCESKGGICGFKNTTTNETGCFQHHKGSPTKSIIAGSVLGSLLLLLITTAVVYFLYNFHISQKENQAIVEKFLKDYEALKPTRYSYAEIKRITNQFKEKLGQGAYGVVFKGKISTQYSVAVKILTISQGNGEDFINEVRTMGRIHHVNIVRLIGFCADGFRRALVYEFLPNGSLQNFINSPDNNQNFPGWEKLQDIALGIAKGIEYLHQGCEQRILHFDIKPHNVLLDHNFTPKICDFGLAKLCSRDQSIVSMTTARGTMGYIAPEVFSRNFGKVSYKSDVYSFGMLLLETIGGRKVTDDTVENSSYVYYPEWIYNFLEEREDVRIHIEDEVDAKIAKKLAIVGLWCIQWHPVDRPSMEAVVQMLEGEGDKLEVPPNPFASQGGTGQRATVPARHKTQPLEIIHELE